MKWAEEKMYVFIVANLDGTIYNVCSNEKLAIKITAELNESQCDESGIDDYYTYEEHEIEE